MRPDLRPDDVGDAVVPVVVSMKKAAQHRPRLPPARASGTPGSVTDSSLTPAELGKQSRLPASPEEARLDPVPNPHPDVDYLARFVAPEFTSICPVTGQPDFAHLVIDYCPDRHLVESKSLKLFLGAFRNHGAFHEDCTVAIAKRIVAAVDPRWLRISGYWYPRGGIPIDVFYQTGAPPAGLYVPDTGVAPYRGRG